MPYLVEEVEIMLKNLVLYFNHKHGEEALLYFTNLAKKEAQEDNWDKENQWIVCSTNLYIKEEEENEVGFEEAQVFIINQKLLIEEAKNDFEQIASNQLNFGVFHKPQAVFLFLVWLEAKFFPYTSCLAGND